MMEGRNKFSTVKLKLKLQKLKLSFKTKRSTHVKHLLDVELIVDAVSEDVLVLPYEGDVGVGQIHPWFLQGGGHSQG